MDWVAVKCIQPGIHIHENGILDSGYQMVIHCGMIIMVLRNFRCFIETVTKCYIVTKFQVFSTETVKVISCSQELWF